MSAETDLAGKPFRKAKTTGRGGRRSKEERQAASRDAQERHWARKFENASSPLAALRIAVDRATTVALNKERRAAAALAAAEGEGEAAAVRQAQLRSDSVRAELTAEINQLIEALLAFAERHETTRV